MIAPTPFFADRGCHTQIYEEIKALQKLGHKIILCTYGLGRDIDGVNIVRSWNPPWYNKLSAGPSFTKIFLLPILTYTVIKNILSFKPQIVHGHLHEGAFIAKVCSFLFPKIKYVFDMQGSLTGELLQHHFFKKNSVFHHFFKFLEKRIVTWFWVVTQSDSMINELINLGANPAKIANVKDGVDTEIFSPKPFDLELANQLNIDQNKPRVLFMGLLETYQGVDLMLEAFALVKKQVADLQFIIIGYPNIEKYQQKAQDLGIAENIRFLGRIDYKTLPRYLSLSPIAMAPKIAVTEGDGKIYNYMAMGMLTIAFDRSVSREILGDTGIFAKMGDAEDLAKKILWALSEPDQAKALGMKSRERAIENLSWDAVGKRISAVYDKMMEA